LLAQEASGRDVRLTHQRRQVFRMLAHARRASRRSGVLGPPLRSEQDRMLALRIAEIGDDGSGLIRWVKLVKLEDSQDGRFTSRISMPHLTQP